MREETHTYIHADALLLINHFNIFIVIIIEISVEEEAEQSQPTENIVVCLYVAP
jgi:hypothetical protein